LSKAKLLTAKFAKNCREGR